VTEGTGRPDGRRRLALITGASSGIGEAFAGVFASEGFDLAIVARRGDRLRAVAERLERRHGGRVHVVPGDLAAPGAAGRLCAELETRGLSVDVLVNNAGYGVPGSYLKSPWDRHEALLGVMVTAVAELTHRLLPGMVERGYGRIVNVASLAGLMPAAAGHTLYAASKAFVVKFSEALAAEVRASGVHVTALCPGFTYSEFHDVTGTRERVKQLPRFLWMDADTVAREGFDAVMAGHPIAVTGRVNRAIAMLGRLLPRPLLNWATRRTARGYRQT
jgi:short-subunit dehydrogenase